MLIKCLNVVAVYRLMLSVEIGVPPVIENLGIAGTLAAINHNGNVAGVFNETAAMGELPLVIQNKSLRLIACDRAQYRIERKH